jgi:hypothetical protein
MLSGQAWTLDRVEKYVQYSSESDCSEYRCIGSPLHFSGLSMTKAPGPVPYC